MKKKYLGFLFVLVLSFITLAGCSSEPKGETKEVMDAIISYQTDVANSRIESNEEKYSYEESDFSFKIWHETNTDEYVADVWIPVQNDPNDQEVLYHYKLGEVDLSFGVSKLSEILASGTYEEVYSSGNFKE
ncbi:hypothetical protein HED39_16830 [Enterococcus casseliflavus]|uniref:hypothetical protein n=1 Tax=Enterococcus casseliflavus TaxID=37734 RepID=UPI00143313F9|nr:hypothetical protein [Enterococcus casseliflavus]NKD30943.1 hypothetical protein [Enterococcus casseliflavus]